MFRFEGLEKDQIVNSRGDVVGQLIYGQWLTKDPEVEAWLAENTEKVRAKDNKGHYIKDDPSTPENEAWTTKIIKKVLPNKKSKKK